MQGTLLVASLIERGTEGLLGKEYELKLYPFCTNQCVYCAYIKEPFHNSEERFDHAFCKVSRQEIPQFTPMVQLSTLERQLDQLKGNVVIETDRAVDPYMKEEAVFCMTRRCMELVLRRQFPLKITTRNSLILRDIDLLEQYRGNPVSVAVSIAMPDEGLRRILEPNASMISERFLVIKELSKRGIHCGILLMPILPYITDRQELVLSICERAFDAGASFIQTFFGIDMRSRGTALTECLIRADLPGAHAFGENYKGEAIYFSPKALELERSCRMFCLSHQLAYDGEDTAWQAMERQRR